MLNNVQIARGEASTTSLKHIDQCASHERKRTAQQQRQDCCECGQDDRMPKSEHGRVKEIKYMFEKLCRSSCVLASEDVCVEDANPKFGPVHLTQ